MRKNVWVWLVAWPILLPLYAVYLLVVPVTWVVRSVWRAARWH